MASVEHSQTISGKTPSGLDVIWRKASYDLDHPDGVTYTTVRTVHLDFVPEARQLAGVASRQ